MTDSWRLDILPSEMLLIIFEYCDIIDLARLSQVCKRFCEIVYADVPWIKKSKRSLVTNQMSERFRKRCDPLLLSARKKCLVSHNWQYGKYKQNVLLSFPRITMPCMQMTEDTILWCDQYFGLINRKEQNNTRTYRFDTKLVSLKKSLFYNKFVLWQNFIITSHSDGIAFWTYMLHEDIGYCIYFQGEGVSYSKYIDALDASSRNVISASRNGEIMIQENFVASGAVCSNGPIQEMRIPNCTQVLSLAIDPTETKFAVGSCQVQNVHNTAALYVVDIEHCSFETMKHDWRRGAGTLDMVWENPHTLLTCGYDSCIRKWDLRCGKCVNAWADPNDTTVYCISSDHQYTMITGTQYNCMAVLWDQRQSDFVQLFYAHPQSSPQRSPIYSLRFDSTHLYCATDRHLIEFEFSDHLCKQNNYKKLYTQYDMKYRGYS